MTTDINAVVQGDAASVEAVVAALAAERIQPRIDAAVECAEENLVLLMRHGPTGVDLDVSFGWTAFEVEADDAPHPTHARALRKKRIHGLSSPQSLGCHDSCTVRKTRSGCGMRIVARPSGVVTAVMPPVEPFGLSG